MRKGSIGGCSSENCTRKREQDLMFLKKKAMHAKINIVLRGDKTTEGME